MLGMDSATEVDRAAALACIVDVPDDLVEGGLVDQWTNRCRRVEPGCHRDAGGQLDHPLDEGVVDTGLDEHAVGTDTRLPRVAKLRHRHRGHHVIEIRIVKDEERRIAAKLEGDLLDRARALLHQNLADLRGTSKRELANNRVARHLATDLRRILGVARDDTEHTRWQANTLGEHHHCER